VRLVVTPAIAFAADRGAAHRRFIIASCCSALALMLALTAVRSPLMLMALVIAMTIAIQTIMPMLDTITMAAVKTQGLDYGRIRLWGSAAFIVASYIAGYSVAGYGPEAVLGLSVAGAALTTAAALMLPRPAADGTASASRKRLTLADALALARDRGFMLFMLTVGAIQASHAVLYVFGVLHWRGQGLSGGFIATLWAIGVVAEIVLFWASRWIVPLGAVQLMMFGACSGLIRWLVMAADPGPAWLVPLQVLHAGTFAATHLGAMQWIATRVPHATAGTAQALLSTFTTGVAMGGAMLLSGPLYAELAGRAYLAMVLLCAAGLAAALLLQRREGYARQT
jgi:MFS transporter, PPP family, 3-phenylpropionic acid transporter